MVIERIYNGRVVTIEKDHYDYARNETHWTIKFKRGAICFKARNRFTSIKPGDKVYFSGDFVDSRFNRKIFIFKRFYSKEEMDALELSVFLERRRNK